MFLLAVALTVPVPSLGGSSVALAALQRAKSFIELMHQRSPGKRVVGQLVKIKHKKLALHERALPKIRKAAPALAAMPPFPAELPPALVDLLAAPVPMEMPGLAGTPVGPFETPGGPPDIILPTPGGFIVPPTETPTPPVIIPPVTPPAVPEPATWATMLLGLLLLGWSLRRQPSWEQAAV